MTDDLRDSFRAATAHEPSPGDAWSRFQGARRRSSIIRGFIALAAAAAAFVALVLLLPGSNPGEGDLPTGLGGSLDPPKAASVTNYFDAKGGFELNFPSTWIGRGLSARNAEFFPPDGGFDKNSVLMDVQGGGGAPIRTRAQTFFVRVHVRQGDEPSELSSSADLARRQEGGAAVRRGGIFPARQGQQRTDQVRVIYPAAPVEPSTGWSDGPPQYWCGGCIVEEVAMVRADGVLEVLIFAPGQTSYDRFHAQAVRILDSIAKAVAPAPSSSRARA